MELRPLGPADAAATPAFQRRARLLLIVLAIVTTRFPEGQEPGMAATLRAWLDTWTGIGHVITGMGRQGYDVQLTCYGGAGWRATFYPAGREHSPTCAVGSAYQPTPGARSRVPRC